MATLLQISAVEAALLNVAREHALLKFVAGSQIEVLAKEFAQAAIQAYELNAPEEPAHTHVP